jgi:hypothetical protein
VFLPCRSSLMFSAMSPLFAHQKQTTVGGDTRALEINFQRRIKRELKGLILFLTHWVEPP